MRSLLVSLALVAVSAAVVINGGETILPYGGILGAAQCDVLWTYYPMTNSCYFQGDHLDFDAAEANCVSLGGHLTSIHNAFENAFIQAMTETGEKQSEDYMTWIGLQYIGNNWKWTDGSSNAYQYWMKGDPSKTKKKDCATLLQDELKSGLSTKNIKGEWHNLECNVQMRKYVCKKAANF